MQTYAEARNPTRQKALEFGVKRVNSHLRVESFRATSATSCHLVLPFVTHVTRLDRCASASEEFFLTL